MLKSDEIINAIKESTTLTVEAFKERFTAFNERQDFLDKRITTVEEKFDEMTKEIKTVKALNGWRAGFFAAIFFALALLLLVLFS